MKLISYSDQQQDRVGLVMSGLVYSLNEIAPNLPPTMKQLAANSESLSELAERMKTEDLQGGIPFERCHLLPVVPDPGKVVCVGLNYADHAAEGGHQVPEYPALFMRGATSLAAHSAPLIRPRCSDRFDYEAELAIVIGKGGRYLSEEEALDSVFAYTVFNDASLRDYQRKGGQWTPGKNFDKTGSLGPWAVTPDELPLGASGLRIQSRLNGNVMQDSNTRHLIFDVAKIISIISEYSTLEPGDVIATGTPGGVGYPRNPPVFMKPGDTIEIDIEGIGVLVNSIEDE